MSKRSNGEILPTTSNNVLIVGGYDSVGQRIARLLANELADRLIVAGRHRDRAERFAAELDSGAHARVIDLANPDTYGEALADVRLVILCLDTEDLKFTHACVARGIHFIDITASQKVIERLDHMQDLALAHGATLLSSVGLAPGLTNLLAKACVQASSEPVSSIDVYLLFGLGDHCTPSA